ncbi:MAG: helical backbone metal receptor [Anaerolineae bacterium]|jgi:ABC-type Fe3+-hydroxamate transport system substrate-binding protein|nr:helical backbone metal receptor [Anaerolineae bacterium]
MSSQPFAHDAPIDHPPQTVISLVPSMTESLFDLGLGGRIIGRTDYCLYPAGQVDAIPTVGGTKNPRLEQIIALRPELVIVNREENRKEDADALTAAGIAVWETFPRTVSEVFTLLWNTMALFEVTEMSHRIRMIEYTFDWLNTIAEERAALAPLRVFVPIWHDPLMTFNADTYAHDVLRLCGGSNIFADRERRYPLAADLGTAAPYAADDPRRAGRDTRYPRITLAEVTAAQPEVILLPSEPFLFTDEHVPLFAALDVPAAHHGRIHLVDGSLLTWHGTRIAYAMQQLPLLLKSGE